MYLQKTYTQRILIRECHSGFRRKCPCIVKVLQPDRWKSLAPLVYFGAAVLAVVIYSMSNVLYGFLSRIFIPQYRYPYMVPLTFTQVVLTLLVLLALHAVGLVTLSPYSLQLGERLLVPSVCDSVQSVLALWAEVNASAGLYPLVMRLLPLISVGWTYALGLAPSPSKHTTFLLSAITVISLTITALKGFPMAQSLSFFYSPLSLLLHSLSLTWLAKVGESEKRVAKNRVSLLDIYFCLTVNKCLVLGFLCLLHPDSQRMLVEGSWHSLIFHGYLLGLLLLGGVQRLLLAITALHYSPLAAALLTSAHQLAKPFSSLL